MHVSSTCCRICNPRALLLPRLLRLRSVRRYDLRVECPQLGRSVKPMHSNSEEMPMLKHLNQWPLLLTAYPGSIKMDCRQTQQLLSPYHDGELPSDQRSELELHLKGCPHCQTVLAKIREFSQAVGGLPMPRPPDALWDRIAKLLDDESKVPASSLESVTRTTSSDEGVASNPINRRLILGSLAAAATLLMGFGLMCWAQQREHALREHDPLAQYAQEFGSDPILAQQRLTTQYNGQTVSSDRAIQLVGYRPSTVQPPPDGFKLDSLYVLDMPCCKCVEAFLKRDDQSCVAIFEHNIEPEEWFQDQSSVQIPCAGKSCRVIEIGDQLAASWRRGRRTITVIGLRDVEELSRLVATLI